MNYLAPQQVMVERLRAQLPASVPVLTAVDIAQVRDQSDGQPQVWVVFHRDQVQDTGGSQTLVEQQLAAIYLAPGLLPDLTRDGQVLTTMTKALAGFDAEQEGMGAFFRVGSMVPQSWTDASLIAYGMLFSVVLDI
jgi:hypothetical protein